MRISKGKPMFGRRDTIDFSTLGEIIHAWLVKFRDDYVELGLTSIPVGLSQEEYLDIIDKMIYAFADIEPEYSGEIRKKTVEPDEHGLIPFKLEVSDEEAWQQYKEDVREHEHKVAEGLKLFGEYFRSLWV